MLKVISLGVNVNHISIAMKGASMTTIRIRRLFLGFFCFLWGMGSVSLSEAQEDPFGFSWDSGVRTVAPGETVNIAILFEIPPGHYLYKNKLRLSLKKENVFELESVRLSPAVLKFDRFSNKRLDVFEEFALLSAQLAVPETIKPGEYRAVMELQYQGCSPKLCFRQQAKRLTVSFTVDPAALGSIELPGGGLVSQLQASLSGRGWMAYALAFIGGVLTDFTPCVLPLIPLTLAVIGIRRETSHRKNFLLTSVLVIGMASTYAVFGVIATALGLQLGFLFQNPYFLLFGSLLFLIFALGLFGLYELQLPLFLRNALAKVGGRGYGGAAIAGMTLGLLAAPCVGPVIGALLVWVAQTQDMVHGFALLFVFGLGMGSLILIVGTFYSAMAGRLHGGAASVVIKWCLGFLLLVPSAYYGYVAYGTLKPQAAAVPSLGAGELDWEKSFEEALQKAQDQDKQVLVDFWAEWCLPCLEWDEVNFSRPAIQEAVNESYVPLKVDCTQNTDECGALVKRYQVVGWPTILVTDEEGRFISGSKIVGDVLEPDEFMKYLDRFKP